MKNVAVILSGSGVYDGAELHEAVLTLLAIELEGAKYQCFAPDVEQLHVVNHLTGEVSEGETGLIAYSGDAFVVSPLTDDANTLISLIPSLTPEIMPSQGSSAMYGLERSSQLLLNAGYQNGHIYWITDGIIYDDVNDIRRFIQNSPFKVSALLVDIITLIFIQIYSPIFHII